MINDTCIVLNDCIPKQYQNEIEKLLLGDSSIPWYFGVETTQENQQVEVTSVMYHMAYYFRTGGPMTELFHRVKPALWQIIEQANLPFHEFLQIRAIIQFPVITSRTHNFIHTDIEDRTLPYYTGVYYVNDDTDGDTVLFDKTNLDVPYYDVQKFYKNFNKIKSVNPQKGKVTLFNGQRYHSSTLPTKKTRSVLNFSWY